LGLAGGASFGFLFSHIVFAISGYYANWLMILLVVLFVFFGGLLAFYR
jgi:hypothetical protein